MEKQRLVIAELGWARIYCPTALTTDVEICEIIYIYILSPFRILVQKVPRLSFIIFTHDPGHFSLCGCSNVSPHLSHLQRTFTYIIPNTTISHQMFSLIHLLVKFPFPRTPSPLDGDQGIRSYISTGPREKRPLIVRNLSSGIPSFE